MAIAYHFFNDTDTWQDMYDEIRSTYDGKLTLAKDLLCWNVTDEEVTVRRDRSGGGLAGEVAVWHGTS